MAFVYFKSANRFVFVPDVKMVPQAVFAPQRVPRTVYDPSSYSTGYLTSPFGTITIPAF